MDKPAAAESPAEYGLGHGAWRAHQYEAVLDVLEVGDGQTMQLEAPTGSGKTAIARAIASRHSVTALCRTKMLQEDNYGQRYDFDVLFGRGNYPCALSPELTGADCEYAEIGMHKCPYADKCEYLSQKAIVAASDVRSLNYWYYLTARWPRQDPTDYLICDEGHLLSDIVLDYVGCTIAEHQVRTWNLPRIPTLSSDRNAVLLRQNSVEKALDWLKAARMTLLSAFFSLEKQKAGNPAITKKLRQCERLGTKIKATVDALETNSRDWFIESGPNGKRGPSFNCRPLTARHHAPTFFRDGWRTVIMSATLGDAQTFGEELGLPADKVLHVPSLWPPETRPVYIPKDAPRLGQAAKREGEGAFEKQADLLARLIKSVPSGWSGIIHHTSVSESKKLTERLARRGLGDRLWLPPEGCGTEEQLSAWHAHRAEVSNALAVVWSWHAGVDLQDERICFVAKVPFPFLGDPYERARLGHSAAFFAQRTAWDLEQMCGRTRREREEDYDTPTEQRGLVAIVDGNWTRVKKHLSPAFIESIVKI